MVFDNIGDIFSQISIISTRASGYCLDIPILGGPLRGFFDSGATYFRRLMGYSYDADDDLSYLFNKAGDILSWSSISDKIRDTWGWIEDLPAHIRDGVIDVIKDQYNVITDFWGNVGIAVADLITSQYSEITDFWGNVGIGIGDWFASDFEDWLEDRAEDVIKIAGRILDKVW